MLLGLEGDPDAYKALLKRLSGYLRAFLMRRMQGWPDDVEDLVQECLLAVHNKRHTYQPDQPLTAWVYAIARYKMIDLLRSKSAREALHEPLDDEAEFLADSTAQTGEAMRDLNILLQTLPDRHRLPIQHVKLEGYSVAEAARQTGMSESAIKVGVHRGLKALAQRIRSTRT
jgi:RNA polymerase sigma-70 factor (ECF subfamily)